MTSRVELLSEHFEQQQNPEKARQCQAYLKTGQPMYGISAPDRKNILKDCLKQFPVTTQEDYRDFVLKLWRLPQREFQYCAIDTAIRYKRYHNTDSWTLFQSLACEAKWWDLVDNIAVNLIGSLLEKDRSYQDILDQWALEGDLWTRRTALLAHLKHKDNTDLVSLDRTLKALMPDQQFFIQKAIGWTLRELSKTNPEWVISWLQNHRKHLSNLAIREAQKHLMKKGLPVS